MKSEKPQKGNPHGLTIKQHIFPTKSIDRFADNGIVQVFLKGKGKIFSVIPKDSIFCASRVWDQRAEIGFMKDIEDSYQIIANDLSKNTRALSDDENNAISDFWSLWCLRFYYSVNPVYDQKLPGIIDTSHQFTKDGEETLESEHIGFIRPSGLMPGRFISGGRLQIAIFNCRKQFKNVKWGVIEAQEGEFMVPDNFSSYMIVPITPLRCFVANEASRIINKDEVAFINKAALSDSKSYYFGRDLTACLGI
jgi:hypothetical protein